MATKRNTTRRSKSNEGGSTLYGALAGLLIGLIVAAAVAFYVTKAPIPFVDRASREPDQGQPLDPRNAPDPNLGLYGANGAAGSTPTGPTATAPIPLSGSTQSPPPPVPDRMDSLGALIATLPPSPSPAPSQPAPATAPQAKTPPAPQAATPATATRRAPAPATGTYFLQAGAYKAAADAESLKARIIMMGLPVAVQPAEVNGMKINRVRVGPFSRLDDMNRARSRLGESKIESAVVRQ